MGQNGVAYIFRNGCGIGFHSNVRSCPQCGMPASRTYEARRRTNGRTPSRRRRSSLVHSGLLPPRAWELSCLPRSPRFR